MNDNQKGKEVEKLESQLEESNKKHDDLRREFDTLIGILKEGGHI